MPTRKSKITKKRAHDCVSVFAVFFDIRYEDENVNNF